MPSLVLKGGSPRADSGDFDATMSCYPNDKGIGGRRVMTINEQQLKGLLKEALVEVMQERRDLIQDVLEAALEDIALARAIEEGQAGAAASRKEVFQLLEGA